MYVVVNAAAVLIVAGLQVPVMPLADFTGNVGGLEFWHNGPMAANVGITGAAIVIFIVAILAHCPAVWVKVYVVVPTVEVLIVAGLHVPVIPLGEVVGRAGAIEF